MSDDPNAVQEALRTASDAFDRTGTPEAGLSDLEDDEAQLRKACRLIEAAETLQDNNGYFTAVVELSFGAIERSFEFYAIAVGRDDVEDFEDHEQSYERAADLGAISGQLAEDFIALYSLNRVPSYYEERAIMEEESDAMFNLAMETHEFLRDHPVEHYNCLCE